MNPQPLRNGDWVEIKDPDIIEKYGRCFGILFQWLGKPYDVAGRATERIEIAVPGIGYLQTRRHKVRQVSALEALALQAHGNGE